MTVVRRTNRGGNRAGRGAKPMDWGRRTASPTTKLIGTGRGTSTETRECPTCHRDIGIRMDGGIRNHRIGTGRINSWPCPGEERPVFA